MVAPGFHIASTQDEFDPMWATVTASIDPRARLPTWPFREPRGNVDLTEWDVVLHRLFVPVLQGLAPILQ